MQNRGVNRPLDRDLTGALFGRSLLTTHEWSVADLEALLAVATRFEQIDRAGGRAHLPVSYTHLRAHETVLDLVCRLLLEKKNINTIQ